MKFFVWLNEQQQGPFDEEAIQKLVSEGQVTHDTLLCPEGDDLEWTPAKELFPPDLSLKPDVVALPIEQTDDGARMEIRLNSGAELKIKAVRLYDEIVLAEISAKRAEATMKLRGVSTGLGAIGSIGWALAASAVIGAAESALSAGAASSGINMLAEVIQMEQKLRAEGVFLPVGRIGNIEIPLPGVWRVFYKRQGQVKVGVTFLGDEKFELREIPSAFIHSGDEFVAVQTEDGSICSIRWCAVERYANRRP